MEHYSRTERYSALRKKIDNMDMYSFYDTEITTVPKRDNNNPNNNTSTSSSSFSRSETKLFNYDHMRKNTLAIEISDLIREEKEYSDGTMFSPSYSSTSSSNSNSRLDGKNSSSLDALTDETLNNSNSNNNNKDDSRKLKKKLSTKDIIFISVVSAISFIVILLIVIIIILITR